MVSRRVFLKNGGLALFSIGLAPDFLARTVAAAAPKRPYLQPAHNPAERLPTYGRTCAGWTTRPRNVR